VNGSLAATSVSSASVTATALTAGSASATALTAGTASATSVTIDGDTPLASAPRMFATAFFPGSLTSTWVGGSIVPDQAITVTRVTATAKTAASGACSPPLLSVSAPGFGQPTENFTVPFDSGPVSLNYAASSNIQFSVFSPAYCTSGGTSASDTNVIVEYSMGPGAANTCGSAFGVQACYPGAAQVCTNISIDPNNCGACGNVCHSGQACTQGFCGPIP